MAGLARRPGIPQHPTGLLGDTCRSTHASCDLYVKTSTGKLLEVCS